MNKSLPLLFIATLILSLILLGCMQSNQSSQQNPHPQSSSETIRIGVIAPLSGDVAFIGEGMRNAFVLAQSQNPQGYKYELIFEDGKFDPTTSLTAAQKLIYQDKVKAIITFSSGIGKVISPLAQKEQVIHFAIASDPTIAAGLYNFIHWTPPAEENRVFVQELQNRNINKLAI